MVPFQFGPVLQLVFFLFIFFNNVVYVLYVTVLEKEFDVLVCWTAVDGELVRGALLPTLSLKYKYRVHAVSLCTQPDTCK